MVLSMVDFGYWKKLWAKGQKLPWFIKKKKIPTISLCLHFPYITQKRKRQKKKKGSNYKCG